MGKITKPLVAGALTIALLSGGVGVYAGTVIDSYKSPRGHIVTVEPVNVHKNRIGISVNGKELETTTWYADKVSYAPLREVAEMLGASVNYDSKTDSADIVTQSKLLDSLGLKLQVPYTGLSTSSYWYYDGKVNFTITSFNPSTNLFEGKLAYTSTGKTYKVKGKISESKIEFERTDSPSYNYVLTFNSQKYTGVKTYNGEKEDTLTITIK